MKTNAEWKYWGRRDPLWAVASWDGKKVGETGAWNEEQFLALGASDFADVLRHWQHYGMQASRCVEIGCGSGRITKQLARTFATVVALDVSEDQVTKAKNILGEDSRNVDFRVVVEPAIPLDAASCDAVFSCHVLQHLPGREAVTAYLRDAHRVLRSGGTLCFHVPVPGAHITSERSILGFWSRNLYKRLKRAVGILEIAEYHQYRAADVLRLVSELGFVDAELRIFAMSSNGDYHSYFFARKP